MADTLEELRQYVGNSQTERDVITASQVGRVAVTLDVAHPGPDKGDKVPPGWHGAFFPGLVRYADLRGDGQPAGGGIAPPVPLARRRLVAVRGDYRDPLRIGDEVEKLIEVAAIRIEKTGAGPTACVTVRETITTPRGVAIVDERDVLYFGEDGPGGADSPPALPEAPAWSKTYEASPVMIFRLSAIRFNSHRIHYDRDYATGTEGYPGLIVPVTLVTMQMMEMCRAEAPDRPLAGFSYRSEKPVFDLGPYHVFGAPDGDKAMLWATDYEDELAVTAEARFDS